MGASLALGQCGLGMAGAGAGTLFGPSGGIGGDNRNTGARKKPKDVKGLAKVPAQVGPSGMIFSTGEVKGAPDTGSPANVPYAEVITDYRKAAENALAREKVPPAYRKRVKEYFGSLNQ